ncbi:hypothetical protein LTR36_010204 [Oleoguttula mirabilis]|uniref:FAD-binding domain-containing protein n=1 Tax=Oleoguttula mirabilis TaxID=1507867 RepID=A0AAV9JSB8_9PEZI|nr:hypothetical protein LTR36_010204 [Oleoguttula mirabilis]
MRDSWRRVAGLAASIALRRAGHDVEIFEKSTFKNEIGAAITLTCNATLVLDKSGFDERKAGATEKRQMRLLDKETLELKTHVDFTGVRERFGGHAFAAFHRVDLHEEMRRMAKEVGVEVTLGTQAVKVDCESGVTLFKDGTEVKKDLIIIADGIQSGFVETITGEEIPTKKTGRSVYRTLIPVSRLMGDPLTRPLFEGQGSGFCVAFNIAKGIMYITYPCRNGELMNIAVFHPTKPHQIDAEDWNSPATVEDVLEVLEGFHPAWHAIAKHADTMHCYTVGHRGMIPCMTKGKAAIIGDAGHPMQPTHAQGAGVSIEDAAALEVLFSNWTTADRVEKRLELFNQLRLPRDNVTQLMSNAVFYYADTLEQTVQRVRQYYSGPLLAAGLVGWTEQIRKFFYSYDAFAEAEKAMEYKDAADGIPDGVIKHFW